MIASPEEKRKEERLAIKGKRGESITILEEDRGKDCYSKSKEWKEKKRLRLLEKS